MEYRQGIIGEEFQSSQYLMSVFTGHGDNTADTLGDAGLFQDCELTDITGLRNVTRCMRSRKSFSHPTFHRRIPGTTLATWDLSDP